MQQRGRALEMILHCRARFLIVATENGVHNALMLLVGVLKVRLQKGYAVQKVTYAGPDICNSGRQARGTTEFCDCHMETRILWPILFNPRPRNISQRFRQMPAFPR